MRRRDFRAARPLPADAMTLITHDDVDPGGKSDRCTVRTDEIDVALVLRATHEAQPDREVRPARFGEIAAVWAASRAPRSAGGLPIDDRDRVRSGGHPNQ